MQAPKPAFHPPEWASQPCRIADIEVVSEKGGVESKVPVDRNPYVLFGRDAEQCEFALDHSSISRVHAALVHHADSRIYLIDLQSTHGTHVDGVRMSAYKPKHIKDGAHIKFGQYEKTLILRCETTGEKRANTSVEAVTDGAKRPSMQKVRASHLLVKHCKSRKPKSWKEPVITRTPEEALEMIQRFRERLVSAEVDFGTLASTESHCSSARRGGDLGEFGPGQMQPSFEAAAFALQIGELSAPVFSDSGVHLILRTG